MTNYKHRVLTYLYYRVNLFFQTLPSIRTLFNTGGAISISIAYINSLINIAFNFYFLNYP